MAAANTIALFLSGTDPARAEAIIAAVRDAWEPPDASWESKLGPDGSLAELSISDASAPGVGAPGQALIMRLRRAVDDANGRPCRISAFVGPQD